MSKVVRKVSISTPFTVADIVSFCQELSGLSADREITLTLIAKDQEGIEQALSAVWATLAIEF